MTKEECLNKIESLVVYDTVKNNGAVTLFKRVITDDSVRARADFFSALIAIAEENGYSGAIFTKHLMTLMLKNKNAFTLACENGRSVEGSTLYEEAKKEIEAIKEIAAFAQEEFKNEIIVDYIPINKETDVRYALVENFTIDDITSFHRKYGCGDVALYRSFRFDSENKRLWGVAHPDGVTFDDLIGYRSQIDQLIYNTEAFLEGYPANNVLLVGARGTGKSSCVKALVNKYFEQGLRLLEITKEQIALLPDILAVIRPRGRKFIIFTDDLSFDESEIEYKYMKSLLEGGSEGKPDNVLFYATSNRRHLIQENWKDRGNGGITDSKEVHTADNMNEKLSLSDRFGITITFSKPTPDEYIEIVKGVAKRKGLDVDEQLLKTEAMKWEIRQKGMSGRTAGQFVNYMLRKVQK
ncbi:MAG TPA: hypothetical protein DCG28_06525 [Lachnospiraceae bacterium]|nr:hypothetical protein [Lachnospiraceae bacterium]